VTDCYAGPERQAPRTASQLSASPLAFSAFSQPPAPETRAKAWFAVRPELLNLRCWGRCSMLGVRANTSPFITAKLVVMKREMSWVPQLSVCKYEVCVRPGVGCANVALLTPGGACQSSHLHLASHLATRLTQGRLIILWLFISWLVLGHIWRVVISQLKKGAAHSLFTFLTSSSLSPLAVPPRKMSSEDTVLGSCRVLLRRRPRAIHAGMQ
jgi:hypothetical protein